MLFPYSSDAAQSLTSARETLSVKDAPSSNVLGQKSSSEEYLSLFRRSFSVSMVLTINCVYCFAADPLLSCSCVMWVTSLVRKGQF